MTQEHPVINQYDSIDPQRVTDEEREAIAELHNLVHSQLARDVPLMSIVGALQVINQELVSATSTHLSSEGVDPTEFDELPLTYDAMAREHILQNTDHEYVSVRTQREILDEITEEVAPDE
jgi:hypothetical protein